MPLGSRDDLANSIHENLLIDFIKEIGKKRDKASNCARRLGLGNLITKAGGSYNNVKKLDCGLKFKLLKDASEKHIANIIKLCKTSKRKVKKEPTEIVRVVAVSDRVL